MTNPAVVTLLSGAFTVPELNCDADTKCELAKVYVKIYWQKCAR